MEYVEGETLAQILARLKRGRDRETSFGKAGDPQFYMHVAKAFADVADGLQHAHSKGVVHRDIKPSNLILDSEERLRILDFGLARLDGQESLTLSSDVVGTPAYMSPEQARRQKTPVDHRTDIYSLGATLYTLLTREPPFRGRDHEETLSRIVDCDPRTPRQLDGRVPLDLETVVLKCLRKETAERYGTAEALAQDLRRFARGDAVEARPEGSWDRLRRRAWHQRTTIGVVVGVVLLGVLGLLLLLAHLERSAQQRQQRYAAIVQEAAQHLQLVPPGRFGRGKTRYNEARKRFLQDGAHLPSSFDSLPLRQAVDNLAVATELAGECVDAHYWRGRGLWLLGETDEALAELSRALEVDDGFAPARSLRAVILERAEAPAEGKTTQPAPEGPGAPDWATLWLHADRAAARGDWEQADRAYTALLAYEEGRPSYLGSVFDLHVARGIARLELDKNHLACSDFTLACDRMREAVAPALLLGKTYYRMGNVDGAETLFAELFERTEFPDQVAYDLGNFYTAFWKNLEGLAWYDRMTPGLFRERARTDALLNAGFYDGENYSQAPEAARRAVAHGPDDALAHALLAESLAYAAESVDAPEMEEVGSLVERALVLGARESPRAAIAVSAALQTLRHLDEAEEVLQDAIALRPELPDLHSTLGVLYAREGRLRISREAYHRASAVDPEPYLHLANIGNNYTFEGQWEKAAEYLRRALAYNPLDAFSHFWLAIAQERTGKTADALRGLVRTIEVEPEVRRHHGPLLRFLRRYDVTAPVPELDVLVRTCEAFLEEGGKPSAALLGTLAVGSLWGQAERDDERALDYARRAVELSDHPRFLLLRGQAEAATGDLRAAVLSLGEARRHRQFTRHAAEWFTRFCREAYPALPSYESVDEMLELPESERPSDAEVLRDVGRVLALRDGAESLAAYLEGRILERAQQYTDAITTFERTVALDADAPPLHLALVRCLRAAGRAVDAAGHLWPLVTGELASHRGLWNLWCDVSLNALGRSPGELLKSLPTKLRAGDGEESSGGVAYVEDLSWLLSELDAGRPLRINCGGQAYAGVDGRQWGDDRFHLGGGGYGNWRHVTKGAFLGAIEDTDDDLLYQTGRTFSPQVHKAGYALPLPNGRYRVALHFAEVRSPAAGMRRFDVELEKDTVLRDYDPFEAVGFATPGVREFMVTVADGLLEMDLVGSSSRQGPRLCALEAELLD